MYFFEALPVSDSPASSELRALRGWHQTREKREDKILWRPELPSNKNTLLKTHNNVYFVIGPRALQQLEADCHSLITLLDQFVLFGSDGLSFFPPLIHVLKSQQTVSEWTTGVCFPASLRMMRLVFFSRSGPVKKKVSHTSVQVRLWGTDVILLWHQPARVDARSGSSEPNSSSGVWSCKMGNIFQNANGRMSATCVCR